MSEADRGIAAAAGELRGRIDGEVALLGEDGWDEGRATYNLCANLEPTLIASATSTDDVVEAVRFAREHGLRLAPVATGHGAACFGGLDDVLLLRTAGLTGVEIDADARIARVGAGARWADVAGPAAERGLVALHGSSGTVGVVGYSVMGGLGWLGRSHGLACNSVLGFEVVTAGGERIDVSAESEPELFWALRGGGGAHAIVTRVDFSLFALSKFYGGSIMWEIDCLPEVAQAWREWTEGAPDELLATVKAVRFPPFPEIPEPLRGRELAAITFAYGGDAESGEELLARLRAELPEPYLDTVAEMPVPALAMIAGDPPDPVPATGGGLLVAKLDEAMISAWSVAASAAKSMVSIELRRLGGALAEAPDDAGALAFLPGEASLFAVAATPTPEIAAAASADLRSLLEAVGPWAAEQTFLPFAEQQPGLCASFPAEVAGRLRAVKDKYDPDGLILGNHIDETG